MLGSWACHLKQQSYSLAILKSRSPNPSGGQTVHPRKALEKDPFFSPPRIPPRLLAVLDLLWLVDASLPSLPASLQGCMSPSSSSLSL